MSIVTMVFRRVIWLLVNLDTPVFRGDGQPERTLLANERTSATRQGRGKPSPYYTRVGRLARPSRVGAIPCGRPVYGHHRVVLAFASNVFRLCLPLSIGRVVFKNRVDMMVFDLEFFEQLQCSLSNCLPSCVEDSDNGSTCVQVRDGSFQIV